MILLVCANNIDIFVGGDVLDTPYNIEILFAQSYISVSILKFEKLMHNIYVIDIVVVIAVVGGVENVGKLTCPHR